MQQIRRTTKRYTDRYLVFFGIEKSMHILIKRLILKPRILFLADGLGAFATAFCLFVILRTYHEFFGMPPVVVSLLAAIAVLLCIFSLSCFWFIKTSYKPFLKIISLTNLLYCLLTISLIIYHFSSITFWGISYFSAEIIIICALVTVEIIALKRQPG